jgi:hypothetical protein
MSHAGGPGAANKSYPATVVSDPSQSLPQHVTVGITGGGLKVQGVGSALGFKWPLHGETL